MNDHPPVTSATIRDQLLWPAMDSRALNLEQARLLADPSPELDSLVEVLDVARPELPPILGSELVSLAVRLNASNGAEGRLERNIAGTADSLARSLRGLELAGAGSPFTSRAVARRLRGPLATIADAPNASASDLVEAGRIVGEVLGAVPAAQIFTAAVEHELGTEKFSILQGLHERKAVRT